MTITNLRGRHFSLPPTFFLLSCLLTVIIEKQERKRPARGFSQDYCLGREAAGRGGGVAGLLTS